MAAIDELKTILDYYGLGDLTAVLNTRITDDPTLVANPDVLLNSIRDTPQYKTRFKGNEVRRANGLPELSPASYVAQENAYRDTLRANSMPKGFYDTTDDFANFIGGDVAPNELNARISQGYNAVMQAEPGTKEELKQLYGLQDSDIAAFFIDPARFQQSDAIRKAQSAQIASEARRQAGIGLTAQQAEALAIEGVDRGTAQQGFATLGQQNAQDVFGATFAGEQALTVEEQIAGTFGTNAAAAQRVATRKRRRQAEFQAGGGFAGSQGQVTGLGTVGE
jgi:hypothetical protein